VLLAEENSLPISPIEAQYYTNEIERLKENKDRFNKRPVSTTSFFGVTGIYNKRLLRRIVCYISYMYDSRGSTDSFKLISPFRIWTKIREIEIMNKANNNMAGKYLGLSIELLNGAEPILTG
jgi:hypothetical protein